MSKDSVRYGRVPKRSREKIEDSPMNTPEPEKPEIPTYDYKPPPNMFNVVSAVTEGFKAYSPYSQEKASLIVRKPFIINLPEQSQTLDVQRILVWQQIAACLTPNIEQIVEFAKRIPGFLELGQDEQLLCIKGGFFEVWIIHASRVISDDGVTFSDGTFLTRQQLEVVFERTFMEMFFHFVRWLNEMHLSEALLSVYSSLILVNPERVFHATLDKKNLKMLHDRLLDALRFQCLEEYPTEPHLFATLVSRLPDLLSFGRQHMESLRWFCDHWSHVKISALFAEVFDIPSLEEVVQR